MAHPYELFLDFVYVCVEGMVPTQKYLQDTLEEVREPLTYFGHLEKFLLSYHTFPGKEWTNRGVRYPVFQTTPHLDSDKRKWK